ncbi:hypothetical protein C0993_008360 [Termitomyces sp. T159_Od127]|nr:hypothetical protein C0993_008360 [Termitomyces sp. T159_Od127]
MPLDTFRKERSLIYQKLLRQRLEETANGKLPNTIDLEKNSCPRIVVNLSLKDIDLIGALVLVLRRMNNVAILFASGQYLICHRVEG